MLSAFEVSFRHQTLARPNWRSVTPKRSRVKTGHRAHVARGGGGGRGGEERKGEERLCWVEEGKDGGGLIVSRGGGGVEKKN